MCVCVCVCVGGWVGVCMRAPLNVGFFYDGYVLVCVCVCVCVLLLIFFYDGYAFVCVLGGGG